MSKFEIFITWLITWSVLLCIVIACLYSHEYAPIPMAIIAFIASIYFTISANKDYDNNVLKKSVKCVKAKLIRKPISTKAVYYGVFLLSNGKRLELRISIDQYYYFNKNDNVTLMYQGWLAHSIKKDTDKIPFFNGEDFSGKKFASYALKYPIQSAKAKVLSKTYGNSAIFLLPDKSKIEMTVSKKQYKALKKSHTFDIIYQGWILHYIKEDEDGKSIFNEDFSSKKILMGYMSKK